MGLSVRLSPLPLPPAPPPPDISEERRREEVTLRPPSNLSQALLEGEEGGEEGMGTEAVAIAPLLADRRRRLPPPPPLSPPLSCEDRLCTPLPPSFPPSSSTLKNNAGPSSTAIAPRHSKAAAAVARPPSLPPSPAVAERRRGARRAECACQKERGPGPVAAREGTRAHAAWRRKGEGREGREERRSMTRVQRERWAWGERSGERVKAFILVFSSPSFSSSFALLLLVVVLSSSSLPRRGSTRRV